jgi:hypothetical protein
VSVEELVESWLAGKARRGCRHRQSAAIESPSDTSCPPSGPFPSRGSDRQPARCPPDTRADVAVHERDRGDDRDLP